MSDSDGPVKVTDKRIFTPDGELREDYRHLDRESEVRSADSSAAPEPEPTPEPSEPKEPFSAPVPPPEPAAAPMPETPSTARSPSFPDLVAMLAEPIALFLGDAVLPDGKSAENLELARFHIDLLEVVQAKTVGNLSPEESAMLEDLLYRLRLRYVQKTS